MKKVAIIFLFFFYMGFGQSPHKFTYQSIIKNSSGYLLKNQDVGLRISVLFNSSNGIPVYSEEHSVESNNNGLVTLIIGDGVTSDVFADIDWGNGEYYLKVEVDHEGGINYMMNQTSQLLSVPYALYAENSSVNLSVIGQSYLTYSANQISANKIDASNDITGLSNVAVSGEYDDLTNTPTLFDGDYANLTNTPTLFDGDYANLTNQPELEDGKMYVGNSDNKSAQISVTGDVTLANDGAVTIADDAVTTAKLANITQGSILVGGASDAPTVYDAKTDGQILVGDGTDIASVAVSGDVTLANDGAVTIADDAVNLTTKVSNVLPIANGGTGANSAANARASLGFVSGTLIWSNKDSGTGGTATFTVSGISTSSIVTGAIKSGNNNTNIQTVTPGDNEITFKLSGSPLSDAVLMYIVIN